MKRLYECDLTEQDRNTAASVIVHHFLAGVDFVFSTFSSVGLDVPLELQDTRMVIQKAAEFDLSKRHIDIDVISHLKLCFANPTFLQAVTMVKLGTLNLHECWYRFANEFVANENYLGSYKWLPSNEQVLAQYIRTSGIIRQTLRIRDRELVLLDTGGQRCERRKWLHAYEIADVVVFVASLAEYGQGLYEEPLQNRLEESLELFQDVCEENSIGHCDIHLVLNKRDEFEQKFCKDRIPLNASGCFPGAPEVESSDLAIDWIQKAFLARQGKRFPNRRIIVHVMCAVNENDVCNLFETVTDLS